MTLEQNSPEVKPKQELTLLQKITFFFIGISSAFTVYALIRLSNDLFFEPKKQVIQHVMLDLERNTARIDRREAIYEFLVRANNCLFGFALTGLIAVSLIIIALWLIRFMDTLFGKHAVPEAFALLRN